MAAEGQVVLHVWIDPKDTEAMRKDIEGHCLKYGLPGEYQPHLKAEAEAYLARIMANFDQCLQTEWETPNDERKN